jgi:hypothetical protein
VLAARDVIFKCGAQHAARKSARDRRVGQLFFLRRAGEIHDSDLRPGNHYAHFAW